MLFHISLGKYDMKILIVSHDEKMSGANISLLNLLKCKNETDEFLIAFPRYSQSTFEKFERIGCKCITVRHYALIRKNIFSIEYVLKNAYRKLYQLLGFERDINKALQAIKSMGFSPDYVISNSFADVFGYFISQKMGVGHVFYVREFMEDDHQISHIQKDINKICENSFAIFISKSIERHYRNKYSFKDTFQIYDYIEPPEHPIQKRRSKILNLCMVGTLSRGKGQFFLLEALKKVEEDGYAGRFMVEFAGEGPMRASLEGFSNRNLSSSVVFMGYLNDIYSFYGRNDVLVVCSNKEALGRMVVEAFYSYKYIVGPDTGEIPDLLDNHRGFIYEQNNRDSLVKIIEDLIDNKSQNKIDLEVNRDYALKEFAANQYVDIRRQLEIWCDREYKS